VYETLLTLHSWMRAALVVLLVVMFVRHARAWMGNHLFRASDRVGGLLLTILSDAQILFGLLLYFAYSPVAKTARSDMGAAMHDPTLRFWAVEHIAGMLLAIVAIHAGKVLSARAKGDALRHRWAALGYGAALLLVVLLSPWPFSGVQRPWVRLGG
jgi:hypothetical protein